MVAVTDPISASESYPVTVVAGEDASGLANIVGQYLNQLFGDAPEKRDAASAIRGRLGLRAREGDVAITVVFHREGIAIEEGLLDPDALISGELEYLMHMLAGRANPARQVLAGTLTIRPGLRKPLFGYQAYSVMRLPGVHIWSALPRPPASLLGGAAVLVGVALVTQLIRHRAVGGDDA